MFESYADPVVHLGELGSGQTTKLLNNLLFTANLGTAATTLSLARTLRISPERLTEVISRGSGNSFALNVIGDEGTLDRLAGLAGTLLQKDVRLIVDLAEQAASPRGGRPRCGRCRAHADGSPPMKVGFVGAGRMGRPMVARLLAAGHDVRVLARSGRSTARPRAAGRGGWWTRSPRPARRPTWCLLCVFTDEQVRQVCLDSALLPGVRAGSGAGGAHHRRAREQSRQSRPGPDGYQGRRRCAGQRRPTRHAAGKLTLFMGGADDTVARLRPLLGCYGDPILHVGPTGAGQKVKLINNALFAGHIGLLAESIRLGQQMGVPEPTVLAGTGAGQRRQPGVGHRRGTGFRRIVCRGSRRIRAQGRRRGSRHRRRARQRSRCTRRRDRSSQCRRKSLTLNLTSVLFGSPRKRYR